MKWYVLAVATPLLLAGCGSSPPTHFFTLNPVKPAAGTPPTHAKGPPLQVRDVQLPPTLDRLEMVLRGPGTQVQVLGSDRWAAPLKGLIRQTLTQDLRDRLGENAVEATGTPTQPGKVQVLIVTVQEFSADASGRVTLDANWALGRGNPPKPVLNRHATVHADAGSVKPGAVADAMSRALGALADRIAAAL
ncbi:MAG TPA: PqiC family protein [Acetobacteraceae bacterium]|nr:PqiC family protein [Acetobacteraceae bacterium]